MTEERTPPELPCRRIPDPVVADPEGRQAVGQFFLDRAGKHGFGWKDADANFRGAGFVVRDGPDGLEIRGIGGHGHAAWNHLIQKGHGLDHALRTDGKGSGIAGGTGVGGGAVRGVIDLRVRGGAKNRQGQGHTAAAGRIEDRGCHPAEPAIRNQVRIPGDGHPVAVETGRPVGRSRHIRTRDRVVERARRMILKRAPFDLTVFFIPYPAVSDGIGPDVEGEFFFDRIGQDRSGGGCRDLNRRKTGIVIGHGPHGRILGKHRIRQGGKDETGGKQGKADFLRLHVVLFSRLEIHGGEDLKGRFNLRTKTLYGFPEAQPRGRVPPAW